MTKKRGRVVGLDVHPDSFAGAVVEGSDAANAQVLSTSTRVELERLEQWALRHTREEDTRTARTQQSGRGGGAQTLRCPLARVDGTRYRRARSTRHARDKAKQVRHRDGIRRTPCLWL